MYPLPVEPETPVEQSSEESKPTDEKGKVNVLPLISLLALAVGGGVYGSMNYQNKKNQEKETAPDPDADYVEDEEEYLVPDEEDDVEEE